MWKYYLPFSYGISSRNKTILHKFSFFILIIFPIIFTGMSIKTFLDPTIQLYISFLGFFITYCTYEIGYLYNDIISTEYEEYPSYWIPMDHISYIKYRYECIIGMRITYILTAIFLLKKLNNSFIVDFLISQMALYIIYALHNTFRSRINILTDLGLQIFKYCSPLLLLGKFSDIKIYLLIIFLEIPMLRWIEYWGKNRLQIVFMKYVNINLLRILYHGIMCTISIFLINNIPEMQILLFVSSVLFLFRISSLLLLKNKKISDLRMENFKNVQ